MTIGWRFVLRRVVIVLPLLALLLLAFLYVEPPRPLWHWAMRNQAQSLLHERSWTGLWINKAIASDLADKIPSGPMSEAERIGRTLVALKPLLISQTEVPHGPAQSEVGIAGLGWCDHVNGFAADVLSHRYPAQIIAVTDHQTKTSHSFARVWSNGWIYFDVWTDEITVFRATPKGAQFLFRHQTKPALTPADLVKIRRAYDGASRGFVIAEAHPSVGDYLFDRISNLIDHGDVLPKGAAVAIAAENQITGGSIYDPPPYIEAAAAREYVEGRIAQVSSKPATAHYRAATKLSSGPFKRAAEVLASREYSSKSCCPPRLARARAF